MLPSTMSPKSAFVSVVDASPARSGELERAASNRTATTQCGFRTSAISFAPRRTHIQGVASFLRGRLSGLSGA